MPVPHFKDITGNVYAYLTVLERSDNIQGQAGWKCLCACGRITHVPGNSLRQGTIKSCGCYRSAVLAERNHKRSEWHGRASHPLYCIWKGMMRRCYCPTTKNYALYGGRGIQICDAWRDLEQFAKDVGERPSAEHTLDRIDNDGNYEPGNVRWATRREQMLNRRTVRQMQLEVQSLKEQVRCLKEEIQRLNQLIENISAR